MVSRVVGALLALLLSIATAQAQGTSDQRQVGQTLAATLNSAFTVSLSNGRGDVGFSIVGLTASGATLTPECSTNIDAARPTWTGCTAIFNSAAAETTLTADGDYRIDVGGRTAVRLRVSVAGVGTIGISSQASATASIGTVTVVGGTAASQQVASDPTVQNAAYASGNCIGGFNAVAVANNNGQSGFVVNFRVVSAGGSVPTLTVYLFDANPSGSTCTDKSTFTLAAADIDKLIAAPIAVTLAAPTGTGVTVGSIDYNAPRPFVAGGSTGSGVKTVYYGLVSGTTFTPGSTTDIHTRIGVALN